MTRNLRYSSDSFNQLRNNSKFQFARSHALSIYQSNAIYTYIPKNACSTLRLSIAIKNGFIADKNQFNWIHNNNKTFVADLRELAKADYTFVIMRCPFRRLASCYLDKIVGHQREAWIFHDSINRAVEISNMNFAFFVDQLSKPNVRNANDHWRPQTDFLVYLKYDDVFCLENFLGAQKKLKEKINLDLVDSRPFLGHDSSHFVIRKDMVESWMLTTADIYSLKSRGQTVSPESLYNSELIEKVKTIYARDIKFYREYCGADGLLFD